MKSYSVIVFRSTEEGFDEAARFNESTLSGAERVHEYQCNQIHWSLAHRTKLGIEKDQAVVVHLHDNREGFPLRERAIV